jgi:hypothetical protein
MSGRTCFWSAAICALTSGICPASRPTSSCSRAASSGAPSPDCAAARTAASSDSICPRPSPDAVTRRSCPALAQPPSPSDVGPRQVRAACPISTG